MHSGKNELVMVSDGDCDEDGDYDEDAKEEEENGKDDDVEDNEKKIALLGICLSWVESVQIQFTSSLLFYTKLSPKIPKQIQN